MADSFKYLKIYKDSNRNKNEVINQKQFLIESQRNFFTKDDKVNISFGENMTSLSLNSESEEYLNIYKIPKTKKIFRITPIKSKTNREKTNINRCKKKINDEIKNVLFNVTNNFDEDKIIMVSELDRDFSICKKDNLLDENKFQHDNNKNMIKQQNDKLKKEIRQNLKKFVKMNLLNINKTANLKNNNNKKIDKPKKTLSKNRLNTKIRYEKNLQNINHHLPNISHIINKLNKNHTVIKRNINNNLISITSLDTRNDKTKINITNTQSSLIKKICINALKTKKKKLSTLTKTLLDKNIKTNKKQQEFKGKKLYFLNKKFNHLILNTNKFIYSNNYNNSINSNTINYSCDKIRREYFTLKKRKRSLFNYDKKDHTSSRTKTGKLIFLTNSSNVKNKNLNYCFNIKKNNLTFKKKNYKVNRLQIQTNINSNNNKIKKYFNTVFSNNIKTFRQNISKNVNKSSLLLMSKILLQKDLLKKTVYNHK